MYVFESFSTDSAEDVVRKFLGVVCLTSTLIIWAANSSIGPPIGKGKTASFLSITDYQTKPVRLTNNSYRPPVKSRNYVTFTGFFKKSESFLNI